MLTSQKDFWCETRRRGTIDDLWMPWLGLLCWKSCRRHCISIYEQS